MIFPLNFGILNFFTAFGCPSIKNLSCGTRDFTREDAFSEHTTNLVWQSFDYKASGGEHDEEREVGTCHGEMFMLWKEIDSNNWSLQVTKQQIFPS